MSDFNSSQLDNRCLRLDFEVVNDSALQRAWGWAGLIWPYAGECLPRTRLIQYERSGMVQGARLKFIVRPIFHPLAYTEH